MIACATLAVVFMAPLFYRHTKGHVLFDSVMSIDHQFDPYDSAEEHSKSDTTSVSTRTSKGAVLRVELDPAPRNDPSAIVGLRMGYTSLPFGPIPGESSGSQTASTSTGTSNDSYDYQDVHAPVF